MSKVYFISDYHFGHAKIIEFENRLRAKVLEIDNIEEHDEILLERTWGTINKRDTLWVLGDNGSIDTMHRLFNEIRCLNINYIPGNHDSKSHIASLSEVKNVSICGITKWKGFWLTHAPIHPEELRGKLNIHGHNHSNVIRDSKYTCVSIENTRGFPIWGETVRDKSFTTYNNFLDKLSE